MNHSTAAAVSIYDRPTYAYRGTSLSAVVADEARHDPSRGLSGGYYLEGLSLGLPFRVAFMNPGGEGREVTSPLDQYDKMTTVWVCGEDQAMESNNITLHATEKDEYGLPVPVVTTWRACSMSWD